MAAVTAKCAERHRHTPRLHYMPYNSFNRQTTAYLVLLERLARYLQQIHLICSDLTGCLKSCPLGAGAIPSFLLKKVVNIFFSLRFGQLGPFDLTDREGGPLRSKSMPTRHPCSLNVLAPAWSASLCLFGGVANVRFCVHMPAPAKFVCSTLWHIQRASSMCAKSTAGSSELRLSWLLHVMRSHGCCTSSMYLWCTFDITLTCRQMWWLSRMQDACAWQRSQPRVTP